MGFWLRWDCTNTRAGCPTLATFLFLWLGWDRENARAVPRPSRCVILSEARDLRLLFRLVSGQVWQVGDSSPTPATNPLFFIETNHAAKPRLARAVGAAAVSPALQCGEC